MKYVSGGEALACDTLQTQLAMGLGLDKLHGIAWGVQHQAALCEYGPGCSHALLSYGAKIFAHDSWVSALCTYKRIDGWRPSVLDSTKHHIMRARARVCVSEESQTISARPRQTQKVCLAEKLDFSAAMQRRCVSCKYETAYRSHASLAAAGRPVGTRQILKLHAYVCLSLRRRWPGRTSS